MVDVAQSVRVTDCGSEGRGFESHLPPEETKQEDVGRHLFVFYGYTASLLAGVGIKNKMFLRSSSCEVPFVSAPAASRGEGR